MTRIFINLPVDDLERSTAFYAGLGATVVEQFSSPEAVGVAFSDQVFAMLQTKAHFATFTDRRIADATESAEALFVLGVDSRGDVDALAHAAVAAGGTAAGDPVDLGFLYRRRFHDPDGHHWEALFLDVAAAPPRPAA